MDNPQEFTQERMQLALDKMECPRCCRPANDLRNVGFSATQYRAGNPGQCFWFGAGTFECHDE